MVPLGGQRALLYIAGQISREGDRLLTGRCPDEVPVEEAARRAKVCALNILAQIESAVGLNNLEQLTQLTGFVLSTSEFGEQPKVLNGASDFLVDVLGEAGRHARAAIGSNSLPFSVTVEIAAVALVRTP